METDLLKTQLEIGQRSDSFFKYVHIQEKWMYLCYMLHYDTFIVLLSRRKKKLHLRLCYCFVHTPAHTHTYTHVFNYTLLVPVPVPVLFLRSLLSRLPLLLRILLLPLLRFRRLRNSIHSSTGHYWYTPLRHP